MANDDLIITHLMEIKSDIGALKNGNEGIRSDVSDIRSMLKEHDTRISTVETNHKVGVRAIAAIAAFFGILGSNATKVFAHVINTMNSN